MSTLFAQSRLGLAAGAVFAAFACALFFYGTGENLILLVIAAALLLVGIGLNGADRLIHTAVSNPGPFALACSALLVLIVSYQLSISKETSFAPSWVLAALPLTYLCVAAWPRGGQQRLWLALLVAGVGLAALSLTRLLAFGERAHNPLVDPNNYASLLYLIWIPLLHTSVQRAWTRSQPSGWALPLELTGGFLLLAGVFATRSRTAALIVVVAYALALALVLLRRRPWRVLVLHGAAGLAALCAVLSASDVQIQGAAQSIGMGVSVRADLVDAGWRMFLDHPAGIGVFSFGTLYGGYRPISEQVTAGLFVHNDYVQLLAEGGIPMLLAVVGFAIAVTISAWRGLRDERVGFDRLGLAIALCALCAHALINFVFYVLPLMIVAGIAAAGVATPDEPHTQMPTTRITRRSVTAAVIAGWVMWLYLVLDLAIAGIFLGQGGVPFSSAVRQSPDAQLQFARIAQAINGTRGMPALGEAALLAARIDGGDNRPHVKAHALDRFRHAIEADAFNPLAYVAMADFVLRHGAGLDVHEAEMPAPLFLSALALDPIYPMAIDRLSALYQSEGRQQQRYALLKNVVFPWIEVLKRRDESTAERYLTELAQLAQAANDVAFQKRLNERRQALSAVAPADRATWFD